MQSKLVLRPEYGCVLEVLYFWQTDMFQLRDWTVNANIFVRMYVDRDETCNISEVS